MSTEIPQPLFSPGDIRVDKFIPTRALFIVAVHGFDRLTNEWWYETNLGTIGATRIGELIRKEDVASWEWANDI